MCDEGASPERSADWAGSREAGDVGEAITAAVRDGIADAVGEPAELDELVSAGEDGEAAGTPPDGTAPGPGRAAARRLAGPGRRGLAWRELPILVVVALAIALVIKTFVVQPFFIPSQSMEDTLLPGDKVLVSKLVYHFRSIDRGDIIVFSGAGSWNNAPHAAAVASNPLARAYDDTLRKLFDAIGGLFGTPAGEGPDYIKRVIGLPGDHVACCNAQGLVTVNGVPLRESSYLYPGAAPSLIRFSIIVPPGRLWVMGDNRQVSADSRVRQYRPGHGTIPENAVIGRAFVIVWPPSRWRTLPIPATFDQPAPAHAAAAAPYAPLAAGAALPLTWMRRRQRHSLTACPRRRGASLRSRRARPATTMPGLTARQVATITAATPGGLLARCRAGRAGRGAARSRR